ncbi:MAG: 2Fe-2S iron-sulfur cluster-binding protein, partial [Sphingomonas sp.]
MSNHNRRRQGRNDSHRLHLRRGSTSCQRHNKNYRDILGSSRRVAHSTPMRFTINGSKREADPDIRASLLDVLREEFALTGTKKGCDHGQCGACT